MLVKIEDAKKAVRSCIEAGNKEVTDCERLQRISMSTVSYSSTIAGWTTAINKYKEAEKALSLAAGDTIEVDANSTIYNAMMSVG